MTTNERASQSRLSTDLEMLCARVKGKSLTLAELKQSLKGHGSAMLRVLLALPFCFVAIPGLSTPFGIAISTATSLRSSKSTIAGCGNFASSVSPKETRASDDATRQR